MGPTQKMKTSVRVQDLRYALDLIKLVAPKRAGGLFPLWSTKIEVEFNKLKLSVTDLERYLEVSIPLYGLVPGEERLKKVLLPTKSFNRFIPRFQKVGVVTLEGESLPSLEFCSSLELRYETMKPGEGYAKVNFLSLLSPEEFPSFLPITPEEVIGESTIDAKWFCHLASIISSAAATDDIRPILTGVYLSNGTMVGADGFRMAIVQSKKLNFGLPEDREVIVPAETLRILSQLFRSSQSITIVISKKRIVFKDKDIYFESLLIDGTYPRYMQSVPIGESQSISILAPVLERFLNMAFNVSIAKLEIDYKKSTCTVRCNELEVVDYEAFFPMEVSPGEGRTGGSVKIAFDIIFLKWALKFFSICDLRVISPFSPGVFTGDIEGLKILMMPMYVSG